MTNSERNMAPYKIFLAMAAHHNRNNLTQEDYEKLMRVTNAGEMTQQDFFNEWLLSLKKKLTVEDLYDEYATWCLKHSSKPMTFEAWKSSFPKEQVL
jgi:hypothetical protein